MEGEEVTEGRGQYEEGGVEGEERREGRGQ